jgi:hypothetical protein
MDYDLKKYTKHDFIIAILDVESKIDRSPTESDYKKHRKDIDPSLSRLKERIGSWNRAKELAGLDKYDNNRETIDYSIVDIESDDLNWENLSTRKRRILRRRKWFDRYKDTLSCKSCSESRNPALQFHHKVPANKIDNVSDMANRGYSKKAILQEVNKCEVLCANCHAVKHHSNESIK